SGARPLSSHQEGSVWAKSGAGVLKFRRLMKRILLFTILFVSLAAPAWAFNGGIQGLVLNAQGGPVRGATVTVTAKDQEPLAKVLTSEDGSYDISNLEPGVYTLKVSSANTQQVLQMDVVVDSETRSEEHTSELQSRFDLVC